ncbi:helix-turn-helix domain-containing protein [Streptomyces sp. NPDC026672]|uniref:winged helix-turn-helix transcriptional regulator n=1 Tax=unclassified Streptomyces TaxID=2593676 RepID=UPI0033EE6A16
MACQAMQEILEVVGRRWTGAILVALTEQPRRFGEFRQLIPGLSDRMLSLRLKELKAQKLLERHVVPATPVQVSYALTPLGRDLTAALQPLRAFGSCHLLPSSPHDGERS